MDRVCLSVTYVKASLGFALPDFEKGTAGNNVVHYSVVLKKLKSTASFLSTGPTLTDHFCPLQEGSIADWRLIS